MKIIRGVVRAAFCGVFAASLLAGGASGDDATGGPGSVVVKWDLAAYRKRTVSVSLANSGDGPVKFRQYLDVQYLLQGQTVEHEMKSWLVDSSKGVISPVIVFVAEKGAALEEYQSQGPHMEGAPDEIAPHSTKAIEMIFDEDYAPSFTQADQMLLLLIKDGKVFQSVTMKRQNGAWKESGSAAGKN